MTKVHHAEIPFTWRRGPRRYHVPPPPSRRFGVLPRAPEAAGAAGDDVAIQLQFELPLGAPGTSPEAALHA
jgi:hypothetical protein